MPTSHYHRIESLSGSAVADADEAALQRLADIGAKEDSDLDFKSELYKNHEEGKFDLAGDVAAMANTTGGVIVLGINDADGKAEKLIGVDTSDGEEGRMRAVIAERVVPLPEYDIREIAGTEDRSYYLITVARSSLRPHGVRNKKWLRYPFRNGAFTEYMSESMIADAYRDRFELARSQVDRLGAIQSEGFSQLTDERVDVWLLVSMVPTFEGAMSLDTARVQQMQQWFSNRRVPLNGNRSLSAEAGVRRVILHDFTRDGQTKASHEYVQLYQDGGGFSAHALFGQWNNEEKTLLGVGQNTLMLAALEAVDLLCAHAVENANATGDAIVQTQLVLIDRDASRPRSEVGLWGFRIQGFDDEIGLRRVVQSPLGQHTIVPSAVVSSAREMLLATRLVVSDVFQSFGIAQAPQIDASGGLLLNTFESGLRQTAKQWAEANGVLA